MDFANIMAYDMRGTWNGLTGLHAALYGPDDNVVSSLLVRYLAHHSIYDTRYTCKVSV